tara:strand:+ start:50493 stop:51167 length:675 start_codon:yes stop_codon:yes gene_type:complete
MVYRAVYLCILLIVLSGGSGGFLPAQQLRPEVVDLRQLAEQGNVEAQMSLGTIYQFGDGVRQDQTEAFKWYLRAAKRGDPRAQSNIGSMYSTGEGVPRDYAKSVQWYRKAAKQGNSSAQFNLGTMYDTGRGVQKNYTEAVKWFQEAAKQGDIDAQFTLGLMYHRGDGTLQNNVQAYKWVRLAWMHAPVSDADDYQNTLETIRTTMTAEEISKAQLLIKKWQVRR